jgi:hypothetical protein
MKTLTRKATKFIAASISPLLLTSWVGAVAANSSFGEIAAGNVEKSNLLSDRSLLLAEAEPRESPWICGMVGEEWADVAYFETQNHFLNICKKKNAPSSLLYVEASKSGGSWISVPASGEGKNYTAEDLKTDTTYIVSVDESGAARSLVNKLRGVEGDTTDVEEIRNEPIVKMEFFSGGQ